MGAMQNPDYRRAPLADLDQYGEKTSEHGHYELASQYKSGKSHFRWVEDNRQFNAPGPTETPDSQPAESFPSAEIQLSARAAEANAAAEAYEKNLLNKQGDATIRGDASAEQQYKNAYQNNLTEELKAKAPTTLANKRAEIEMADKQAQDINADYALDLGAGMYR